MASRTTRTASQRPSLRSRRMPLRQHKADEHGNAANSNRVHFLLLGKLSDAPMASFYDNPEYDGKGFEMVAHLCQQYAPSKETDVFVNMQSLMFLEHDESLESVPQLAAKIRKLDAALTAGGETVPRSILTMTFMKCLDDRYDYLKSDFKLNPNVYLSLSINKLEEKVVNWAVAEKILGSSIQGSASAVARGPGATNPSPPAAAAAAPPTASHSSGGPKAIARRHSTGTCECGRKDHTLDQCHQYMLAGFCIEYNPDKAKEKRRVATEAGAPGGPKKKKGKTKSSSSASVASQPSSTPASGSAPVGGAAHASSANRFAPLNSDDESDDGDMARDMGVVQSYASATRKSNSTSALYPTAFSHSTVGVHSVCTAPPPMLLPPMQPCPPS